MPSCPAAAAAAGSLSPVSMTVLIPSFPSSATAPAAVSLTVSEITSAPRYFPSSAIYATVPPSASLIPEILNFSISLRLPARISFPSFLMRTPQPAISSACPPGRPVSFSPAALRIDSAIGWLEALSAAAAVFSSRSSPMPAAGRMRLTSNTPRVRVPVLSKTAVLQFASVSR